MRRRRRPSRSKYLCWHILRLKRGKSRDPVSSPPPSPPRLLIITAKGVWLTGSEQDNSSRLALLGEAEVEHDRRHRRDDVRRRFRHTDPHHTLRGGEVAKKRPRAEVMLLDALLERNSVFEKADGFRRRFHRFQRRGAHLSLLKPPCVRVSSKNVFSADTSDPISGEMRQQRGGCYKRRRPRWGCRRRRRRLRNPVHGLVAIRTHRNRKPLGRCPCISRTGTNLLLLAQAIDCFDYWSNWSNRLFQKDGILYALFSTSNGSRSWAKFFKPIEDYFSAFLGGWDRWECVQYCVKLH